MLYFFGMKNIN